MGQFTSGKIVAVTLLAEIFGCLAIKTMDPKEIEISPGVSCCEQKVLKPKGQLEWGLVSLRKKHLQIIRTLQHRTVQTRLAPTVVGGILTA